MSDLTNLSHEQAVSNGWQILKPLNCEVVGKAVFDEGNLQIMKSTKRFKVEGGWIYNTSTEIRSVSNNAEESNAQVRYAVAEALVFVPDIK